MSESDSIPNLPANQAATAAAWYFEQHQVRMFLDAKANPWWVLSDVCVPLGFAETTNVAVRLKDDEKTIFDIRSGLELLARVPGTNHHVVCINEKGLYRVIFRSDKPEAQRFQDWVFGEVLPQIRKTGKYDLKGPRAKKIAKYVRKGKQVEWAEVRVDGIEERNGLTKVLKDAGVTGYGAGHCTDAQYKVIIGSRARDARAKRGLPAKANLREALTTNELRLASLADLTAQRAIPETGVCGDKECIRACGLSAQAAITAMENAHLDAVRMIRGGDA